MLIKHHASTSMRVVLFLIVVMGLGLVAISHSFTSLEGYNNAKPIAAATTSITTTHAPTSILPPQPFQCIIQISGLPRTGTGILQRLAIDRLGREQSSWFQVNPNQSEQNEGHLFATNLVPFADNNRHPDRSVCYSSQDLPLSIRAHICPQAMDQLLLPQCPPRIKQAFWESWARLWDLSKPYLFQKTPTLRIWMLEACFFPPPSVRMTRMVHLISLRHPLFYWSMAGRRLGDKRSLSMPITYLEWWLEVWAWMIENGLSSPAATVVRFETLLTNPQHALEFLPEACRGPLDHVAIDPQQQRRRLELQNEGMINLELVWKPNVVTWWRACLKNELCQACLASAEPGANALGYSLLHPNLALNSTTFSFTAQSLARHRALVVDALHTSRQAMLGPCELLREDCSSGHNTAASHCKVHKYYN